MLIIHQVYLINQIKNIHLYHVNNKIDLLKEFIHFIRYSINQYLYIHIYIYPIYILYMFYL